MAIRHLLNDYVKNNYQSHYIIDKHNLKYFFKVQNMKEKEWGKQHQTNDNFNKLSCFDVNKKGRKICLTIIFRLSSCQNKFNCRKKWILFIV